MQHGSFSMAWMEWRKLQGLFGIKHGAGECRIGGLAVNLQAGAYKKAGVSTPAGQLFLCIAWALQRQDLHMQESGIRPGCKHDYCQTKQGKQSCNASDKSVISVLFFFEVFCAENTFIMERLHIKPYALLISITSINEKPVSDYVS